MMLKITFPEPQPDSSSYSLHYCKLIMTIGKHMAPFFCRWRWSAVLKKHLWCSIFCIVMGTFHCTALRCTALHCTELNCTALHCPALHCTALRCILCYPGKSWEAPPSLAGGVCSAHTVTSYRWPGRRRPGRLEGGSDTHVQWSRC